VGVPCALFVARVLVASAPQLLDQLVVPSLPLLQLAFVPLVLVPGVWLARVPIRLVGMAVPTAADGFVGPVRSVPALGDRVVLTCRDPTPLRSCVSSSLARFGVASLDEYLALRTEHAP
jgi:hypothetical protein